MGRKVSMSTLQLENIALNDRATSNPSIVGFIMATVVTIMSVSNTLTVTY